VVPTVSFTRALERFLPAPSATVEGATEGAAPGPHDEIYVFQALSGG
jgi:hypothetical protein